MIFESKQELDELVDEVEQEFENKKKKKKPEKPKEGEGVGGAIPLSDVLPPSFGRESGETKDAWVEGFEDRILKVIKEKEAVGEIQSINALGHNNPRVNPSDTPSKQRRAKADKYGSTRKGEGTPESQKKKFGAEDPLTKLATELGEDETEQDQQGSEEETS
jgi:hypothetical protein